MPNNLYGRQKSKYTLQTYNLHDYIKNPTRLLVMRTTLGLLIILECEENKMVKKDIITAVSKRTGFTRENSEAAINAAIEAIVDAIKSNEEVRIMELGKLEPVVRAARNRHNPKTGEKMFAPAYKSYRFKMNSVLKDFVRNN